jgi:hypothetical protein
VRVFVRADCVAVDHGISWQLACRVSIEHMRRGGRGRVLGYISILCLDLVCGEVDLRDNLAL